MARYTSEADAAQDGFTIAQDEAGSRFTITKDDEVVGEAHYTLVGNDAIDFDHTLVSPDLRGTGLSGLLAEHALTSAVAAERRTLASCWFIEGYLQKHPHLARA